MKRSRIHGFIQFHILHFTILVSPNVFAQEMPWMEDSRNALHSTYIWQKKPAFTPQPGAKPLLNQAEKNYSLSSVWQLGKRVWQGGEFYFNAEVEKSMPFAGMADVAGPTNGEDGGTGGRATLFYPRLFLRQTYSQGGISAAIPAAENQLAGWVDQNRFSIIVGRFSLIDFFGKNSYTFDPTLHFMNWSNTTYAAYDYAADAHGYSWGVVGEWYHTDWAVRFGRAAMPYQRYGLTFDTNLLQHYGDQVEIEHRHQWAEFSGKTKLLAWRNRAVMGSYQVALQQAAGQSPDVAKVRQTERVRYGIGMDIEQAISPDLGLFLRLMTTDGASENFSYLEVDDSWATGMALNGAAWQRREDTLGIVLKGNALSRMHQRYLHQGGVSIFNTQGLFEYRPEVIVESYYNWQASAAVQVTLDYQHILNPSYNAYRGPVDIYGMRIHVEY